MERALHHCQNSYRVPNMHLTGYCCRTNLPSFTAFRGFGAPQAMFVAETIIRYTGRFDEKCLIPLLPDCGMRWPLSYSSPIRLRNEVAAVFPEPDEFSMHFAFLDVSFPRLRLELLV